MSLAEAQAFFERYAASFTRGDIAAVSDARAMPCFISGPRSGAFADAEAFARNTEGLLAFYAAQGLARAEKTVLSAQEQYDGVTLVRTADRLSDASGEEIACWEHVYLMRRFSDGWKVVAAVCDGEVEAWAARGTPLGRPPVEREDRQ